MKIQFFIAAMIMGFTGPLWAQSSTADSPQWEAGVLFGKLLPNNISGITEIMGLGGVHLGYQLSPMVYLQPTIYMGKGSGQSWKEVGLSVRLDQKLDEFLVGIYAGAHNTFYKGPSSSEKNEFGGQVGGNLMTNIGGPTWIKMDMTFSFGPGTALFIFGGLLLRF